jgi:hypothetical protein
MISKLYLSTGQVSLTPILIHDIGPLLQQNLERTPTSNPH